MSNVNGERQGAFFPSGTTGPFAAVVLNRPVESILTYHVPAHLHDRIQPGQRVRVPLGKRNEPTMAYCVRVDADLNEKIDANRIKDVIELVDEPALIDERMLKLTHWLSSYYACTWGQALDAVIPAGVKKAAGTVWRTFLKLNEEVSTASEASRITRKQQDILALLGRAQTPLTVEDVCRMVKCGPGVVKQMRDRALILSVRQRTERVLAAIAEPPREETIAAPHSLTDEQSVALNEILPALGRGEFATFLLHGVTGSGKTEVYLSAIEKVVAAGKEAIVLVPEISLTPQTIRRFRRRFEKVAVLHSHLSDVERHKQWKSIAAGEVRVVVGARSAVFAPCRKLGLIVIDEEHESSFKQETVPRYHARDVAVKRAQLEGVPVILGSATPSLESWNNAQQRRYRLISLARRVAGRAMPEVTIIDLRHDKPSKGHPARGLSTMLEDAMRGALDDGGQVMLFLNRRGFHTFILCTHCGQALKCHSCDVALTHHKVKRRAICHFCDAESEPPKACPSCHAPNLIFGGIGTERLEAEVRSAFPDRVIRRMDSDTMRSHGSHERVLHAFKNGQIDILLGTQMIAKGLDFPEVTLVGVVNADSSLHLPDFRAAERTFQLVAQVAGRAGRGDRPGRVLVQTFCPDAPSIRFAARHDYLGFVTEEMAERRHRSVPPFGRLVRLIARGAVEKEIAAYIDDVAREVTNLRNESIHVFGPAPAPVAKIRDLYRFHISLRASSARELQAFIKALCPRIAPPGDIELAIDVDPVSML